MFTVLGFRVFVACLFVCLGVCCLFACCLFVCLGVSCLFACCLFVCLGVSCLFAWFVCGVDVVEELGVLSFDPEGQSVHCDEFICTQRLITCKFIYDTLAEPFNLWPERPWNWMYMICAHRHYTEQYQKLILKWNSAYHFVMHEKCPPSEKDIYWRIQFS